MKLMEMWMPVQTHLPCAQLMLKRLKHLLLTLIVVTYILFEELIWEGVVIPAHTYISSLHIYERFITFVSSNTNRYVILLLFIAPFIAGEGLGIISGVLAVNLHLVLAIVVYLLKIPLVFIALSVLNAGKEKLMSFIWFAKSYNLITLMLDKIKHSEIYTTISAFAKNIKSRFLSTKNSVLTFMRAFYFEWRSKLK
jgi:uncharacterized membrane protein